MRILIRLSLKTKSTLYTYFSCNVHEMYFNQSPPCIRRFEIEIIKNQTKGPAFKIISKIKEPLIPRYFKNLRISMKELAKKLANFWSVNIRLFYCQVVKSIKKKKKLGVFICWEPKLRTILIPGGGMLPILIPGQRMSPTIVENLFSGSEPTIDQAKKN